MVNREKVLHGLNSCGFQDGFADICGITECPYREHKAWCVHELTHDAGVLINELLKAQEPVAPIFDYDGRDVWLCGNCHRTIFHPTRTDEDENQKNYRRFCFHCGQAVKWNG